VILVITNREDVHPTPVIEYFHERDIPVFRLNTEALLTDYQFNWRCDAEGTDFRLRNTKNGLVARGSEITAVWERRPAVPSELPVGNRPEINRHNLEEARGFLAFLTYYLKDVFSIGDAVYDRVAASKMLQLRVAGELGMKVPGTCFSNRKEDILRFAGRYPYIVLKPVENDSVWLGDGFEYVFYTRKIPAACLAGEPEEAFSQTVSHVQEYVEKQFELRVTVVVDEVFACKIDSQAMDDDKGKIDWRQGYEHGLKHEIFPLPECVADFCIAFLQRMKLHFGCFDFIVTPAGEYVFLECNPNGQWLWIEMQTGMKISAAIAGKLSAKHERCLMPHLLQKT
jgi:hypothetical protein